VRLDYDINCEQLAVGKAGLPPLLSKHSNLHGIRTNAIVR
jgi:hypothetical protein